MLCSELQKVLYNIKDFFIKDIFYHSPRRNNLISTIIILLISNYFDVENDKEFY